MYNNQYASVPKTGSFPQYAFEKNDYFRDASDFVINNGGTTMTLNECYQRMKGNYEEAKGRLSMDPMIEHFLNLFLEDTSMDTLRAAVADGNIPESFRAAHTLKGVAANLAFTELQTAASQLTEQLRPQTTPADPDLVQKVETAYGLVVDSIKAYSAEK